MTMDLVYGVGFAGLRFISDPIGELGRSASLFHERCTSGLALSCAPDQFGNDGR